MAFAGRVITNFVSHIFVLDWHFRDQFPLSLFFNCLHGRQMNVMSPEITGNLVARQAFPFHDVMLDYLGAYILKGIWTLEISLDLLDHFEWCHPINIYIYIYTYIHMRPLIEGFQFLHDLFINVLVIIHTQETNFFHEVDVSISTWGSFF